MPYNGLTVKNQGGSTGQLHLPGPADPVKRTKMSFPIIIPAGTVFGQLVVDGDPIRKRTAAGRPDLYYPCKCSCGTRREIMALTLRNGGTTSCGCKLRKGNTGPLSYSKQKPEYHSWRSMKARCRNPKDPGYERYGGRGIKVCDHWFDSFEAFLAYMGTKPTPKHSLDRYPDKNGNYEPGNVRWADVFQQNRNTRSALMLTFEGRTMSLPEWAEDRGWPRGLLYQRIRKGMPLEEALTKPPRQVDCGHPALPIGPIGINNSTS